MANLKFLIVSIYVFICFCGCFHQKTKFARREWKATPKTLAKKCDTLILRQICDYCLGEKSYYSPKPFSFGTTCLCFGINSSTKMDKINDYLIKHGNEINVVVIENPSNIIYKLDFLPLHKIEAISFFGNDYGCDAIKTIPVELLSKLTFKKIIFKGVRFPKKEIERLSLDFPKIKILGDTLEYEVKWDQSISSEE